MKAHELIADPERHCQRSYARNKEGDDVLPNDPTAVCWCASGAMRKCYRDNRDVWRRANDLARARHALPLSHVNDRLGHAAVWQILKDLDI